MFANRACEPTSTVQVHRAVSDITGQTRMAIVQPFVGGERKPRALAWLRGSRCQRIEEEFTACLTGNWREEHLFGLELALRM